MCERYRGGGRFRGGVLLGFPSDWDHASGLIAKYFSFSATEIMEFEVEDYQFWMDRVKEQTKDIKRA